MDSNSSAASSRAEAGFLRWSSDAECLEALHAFAPELHVCDAAAHADFVPFGVPLELLERAAFLIRTEGYFQLDPPVWNLPIGIMADTVAHLQQRGLPTALCFLYDEFWLLFAKLHFVLGGLLDETYKLLPDFWAWCVGGQGGDEAGWSPHRDRNSIALNPDGSPRSLTVWVPLTDATPLNGCMYIVPADRDRGYPDAKGEFDLSDVRALPAAAGSVFLWNQAVFHWGGRRSPHHEMAPRVSVAFEFQAGRIQPFKQPLLAALELPRLPFRMKLVATQILQYQHMYPLSAEAKSWAEEIVSRPAI